MIYAEVAVSSRRPQRDPFTYTVPSQFTIAVGDGVFVPFGRQVLQGVVLGLAASTTIASPRPILAKIDDPAQLGAPLLTRAQVALARSIADAYLASLFPAVALFLPPNFERKPVRTLHAVPFIDASALNGLSERERRVLDAATARRSATVETLQTALHEKSLAPTVRALIKRELLEERYGLSRPAVRAKTEEWLHLAVGVDAAQMAINRWPQSRRSRQADLLERLQAGPAPMVEARKLASGAPALNRWRAESGLIAQADEQVRLGAEPAAVDSAIASLRRSAAERHQVALLETLLTGPHREPDVRVEVNATRTDIEALIEAGLVKRETRRITRNLLVDRTASAADPRVAGAPVVAAAARPALTAYQARAYRAIAEALDSARETQRTGRNPHQACFLLHGVTGSGKTEVYLAAAERARDYGGRALILVPEIALTPQTADRFLARFPGRVAVFHTGVSAGAQYDEWERIRRGEVDVVVGSRSALFVPLPDLTLIVVDEEHEWTYKQTAPPPRYHVREVAERYSELTGAVVVYGSATPDVVTASRARDGRYTRLDLPQRVYKSDPLDPASPIQSAPLPAVEIVDMREELVAGNRSIFSRALRRAISEALEAGDQVMLFLNRRGVASMVCRACGEVQLCDRCAVPFTVHQPPQETPFLRCHECNRRATPAHTCSMCGSDRIRPMGAGTQKLEDEVRSTFALARPLRWDRDTVIGREGHRDLLDRFVRGEANVLVGTQMIAKGLDLPAVTVVGVVNADLSLRLPDYTGPERTFQLITQVAGRAGRGVRSGRVIVQTYAPEHPAITAAAAHDYDTFLEIERTARAQHDYPPFGRLARLVYQDRTLERARATAENMAASLVEDRDRRGLAGPEVLGPTPAFIAKQRGQYRQQITLRGGDPHGLLRGLEFGRGWTVDIDPVSLL